MMAALVILYLSAIDAAAFGVLTDMHWGSTRQARPFETIRNGWHYHVALGSVTALALAWLYTYDPVQAVAAALVVATAGHDLMYHVMRGHFLPRSGWRPFGSQAKVKPTNALYWPIRGLVLVGPRWRRAYAAGVPQWAETAARVVGLVAAGYIIITQAGL